MEQNNSNAGQALGIAGLIVGIIGVFLAVIPCTAVLAVVLAIVGIVLSAIGLSQANKAAAPRGLVVAALTVSCIGLLIAGIWGVIFAKVATSKDWNKTIEFFRKMEDLDSLKVHELDTTFNLDSVNINDETFDKLEKDMDNLHKGKKDSVAHKKHH